MVVKKKVPLKQTNIYVNGMVVSTNNIMENVNVEGKNSMKLSIRHYLRFLIFIASQ